MLELACRIGLGVDIGDLLEFERALGAQIRICAAADEKEMLMRREERRK